jgi:hypothetical protein
MAVINLTSEEFADRIEEMLDLADKGDKVFIYHEGKTYTVIPISDEEFANQTEEKNIHSDK